MSDIGRDMFRKLAFWLREGASIRSTQKTDCSTLTCFVFLLITKASAFCGEKMYLSATEGKPVVLYPLVGETEELSVILWIRDDVTEIATIRYLNGSADIQYNGNGGKFNISSNASLTINNFNVEDEGTYIVVIKQLNKSDCKHTFHVNMSEESPCGDIKDVAGKEEEEITLSLGTDGVQFKISYWFSPRRDLLAKTKPGSYIQPQKDYKKRLKSRADGSLTIKELTMKDQGTYIANVHMYNGKSCSQKYNVTISGVIPETANMKPVHVSSSEEQEVTLPLPEHLLVQVKDVFWMKDNAKHIATTFSNGSVHVLESRYQGRLQSRSNGSLIIFNLCIEDRGKYSADIHLLNKKLYTEIYHLSIYRKSNYILLSTRNISGTEGGDLTLKNDIKETTSINWLTQRWIRFAVTKLGGEIYIFNQKYSDRLSSLSDGSITIKRLIKNDEGTYRAHMFSHNGSVLVQQYQVSIYEDRTVFYALTFSGLFLVFSNFICFVWLMMKKRKQTAYEMKKTKQNAYEIKKPIDEECEMIQKKQIKTDTDRKNLTL